MDEATALATLATMEVIQRLMIEMAGQGVVVAEQCAQLCEAAAARIENPTQPDRYLKTLAVQWRESATSLRLVV